MCLRQTPTWWTASSAHHLITRRVACTTSAPWCCSRAAVRSFAEPCVVPDGISHCGAAADPRRANKKAAETLDVIEWLGEREGQMYGDDKLRDPSSSLRACYGVFTKAFSEGFLWPTWSKQTHQHFPRAVRRAITTVLLVGCACAGAPRALTAHHDAVLQAAGVAAVVAAQVASADAV